MNAVVFHMPIPCEGCSFEHFCPRGLQPVAAVHGMTVLVLFVTKLRSLKPSYVHLRCRYCELNPDVAHSQCSVPQEKSNDEINEELGLSVTEASECSDGDAEAIRREVATESGEKSGPNEADVPDHCFSDSDVEEDGEEKDEQSGRMRKLEEVGTLEEDLDEFDKDNVQVPGIRSPTAQEDGWNQGNGSEG